MDKKKFEAVISTSLDDSYTTTFTSACNAQLFCEKHQKDDFFGCPRVYEYLSETVDYGDGPLDKWSQIGIEEFDISSQSWGSI